MLGFGLAADVKGFVPFTITAGESDRQFRVQIILKPKTTLAASSIVVRDNGYVLDRNCVARGMEGDKLRSASHPPLLLLRRLYLQPSTVGHLAHNFQLVPLVYMADNASAHAGVIPQVQG